MSKMRIRLRGRDGRRIPECWSSRLRHSSQRLRRLNWSIGVLVMKKTVVLSFRSSTPWPRPGLPTSEFFMVRYYINNNNGVLHTCRARAGHHSITPGVLLLPYPTLERDREAPDVFLRWVIVSSEYLCFSVACLFEQIGRLEDDSNPSEVLDRKVVLFFRGAYEDVVLRHTKLFGHRLNHVRSKSTLTDNKLKP